MEHFVFLFRQYPTHLSEADQKRRAKEVRAWALRQNAEGHKLDPRILTTEKHRVEPDSKYGSGGQTEDESVIAITFIDAHDFVEVRTIAETHPGLGYGVSIEVRPWTRPPAPTTQPSTIDQK